MFTQDTYSGSIAPFQSAPPARQPFVISGPLAPRASSASAGTDTELNAVCINLTARQRDVLSVMMQGKSNKAICRILNLAEPTVKNHVTAILKALKVTNRTEAVIKVAKASAASMSYTYTISGYSTFQRR
jgi:DNA-binding NarL/FixJ family response regulator